MYHCIGVKNPLCWTFGTGITKQVIAFMFNINALHKYIHMSMHTCSSGMTLQWSNHNLSTNFYMLINNFNLMPSPLAHARTGIEIGEI